VSVFLLSASGTVEWADQMKGGRPTDLPPEYSVRWRWLRLLHRDVDHAAPFGPGAVVVLDVLVAEEVAQGEPGVRGALADAAVGDDVLAAVDTLARVELLELLHRLEGAILGDSLAPRHVGCAGNVTAALCGLHEPRRREDLAAELSG